MRLAHNIVLGLLWGQAVCLPLQAQAQGQNSGSGIYSCVDGQGRRMTSDRPISQCSDREQRVLGPSGVERNRVGPALSEVEIKQQLEEHRAAEMKVQRAREQRRRDAALLVRYPTRQAHDAERRSSLSQIESLQIIAQRRLLELERAHFQLQQELQFYTGGTKKAPARLQADLQQSQASIDEQKTFMASQEAEKRRVHQRFDGELERLAPLWASK